MRGGCATKPASFQQSIELCPGAFSSIRTTSPQESHLSYFDPSGKLIAGSSTADYQRFCDGTSSSVETGARPKCESPLEKEPVCPDAR